MVEPGYKENGGCNDVDPQGNSPKNFTTDKVYIKNNDERPERFQEMDITINREVRDQYY